MPTSSSTISMSLAGRHRALYATPVPAWRKISVTLRAVRRAVRELDAAVVLVDDLLDDREAEAGALRLGRHVGLERPVQHVVGEPGAAVGERERRARPRVPRA